MELLLFLYSNSQRIHFRDSAGPFIGLCIPYYSTYIQLLLHCIIAQSKSQIGLFFTALLTLLVPENSSSSCTSVVKIKLHFTQENKLRIPQLLLTSVISKSTTSKRTTAIMVIIFSFYVCTFMPLTRSVQVVMKKMVTLALCLHA